VGFLFVISSITAEGCSKEEEAPKPAAKKVEEVKPAGPAKPAHAPSAEKK
jgi:hypothetical protein